MVPLSLAAGLFAARLNRSAVGWMLFCLLLSPLVGFVFLLVLGTKERDTPDRVPCPSERRLYKSPRSGAHIAGATYESAQS
jgi:hypothetical protein